MVPRAQHRGHRSETFRADVSEFMGRFLTHENGGIILDKGNTRFVFVAYKFRAFLSHVTGNPASRVFSGKSGWVKGGAYLYGEPAADRNGFSRWTCIDIDFHSSRDRTVPSTKGEQTGMSILLGEQERAICRRCEEYRLDYYATPSKSNTGAHVFVFHPMPVWWFVAREAGLHLIDGLTRKDNVEVFPKSGGVSSVYLPCEHFREDRRKIMMRVLVRQRVSERMLDFYSEVERAAQLRSADRTAGLKKEVRRDAGNERRRWVVENFPMETVYGHLLCGVINNSWLRARDVNSKTGDRHPSAAVATGAGQAERGTYHSFITGESWSVFDFLIGTNKCADYREAFGYLANLIDGITSQ